MSRHPRRPDPLPAPSPEELAEVEALRLRLLYPGLSAQQAASHEAMIAATSAQARSMCVAAGYDPDAWSLKHPGVTLAAVPGGHVAFWGNNDVVPLWEHWLPQARSAQA